jgi:uncharacterized membrane protein YhfC
VKRFFTLAVWFSLLAGLSGCAASQDEFQPEGESVLAYRVSGNQAGAAYPLAINARNSGEVIYVSFHGKVETGRLSVILVDANENVLWNPGSFGEALSITDYVELPNPGIYRLGVQWKDPVKGYVEYSWRNIADSASRAIPPLAYLGSIGMLVVALGYLAYAMVSRLPWKYLGLGAICWFATVFLKSILASFTSQSLYQSFYQQLDWNLAGPLFFLYIGLLTGITEVLLVWLVLRYSRLGSASWKMALAFGIGFGVFEAFLLGVNGVVNLQLTAQSDLNTLSRSTWTNILLAGNPLVGLAPISERFFTILIHIFCNVALFYGVNKNEWRWLLIAFLIKTGVDTVAGFAQNWGSLYDPIHIWLFEGIIIAFGLLSLAGIYWIFKRYPDIPIKIPEGKKPPV